MGKKDEQLGMAFGTANNRLKKLVMFDLLVRLGENKCFQCGDIIESSEEMSIEHKRPWLDVSVELFWDLENISFSHLSCNSSAGRPVVQICPHGHDTFVVGRDKTTGRCNECCLIHGRRNRVR